MYDDQASEVKAVMDMYAAKLRTVGFDDTTTDISPAGPFYMAEDYHQQYLFANSNGYCGIGGTGVSCPVGLAS